MNDIAHEELELFRTAQLKARLKLEMFGMCCKGPTAYATAKRLYGLKGSRAKVLEQLTTMVEEAINVPH